MHHGFLTSGVYKSYPISMSGFLVSVRCEAFILRDLIRILHSVSTE